NNYFTRNNTFKFYNDSYTITASADVTKTGAQGVLFSFGNTLGGISLYVKDKKLAFAYNADGKLIEVKSTKDIPSGKVSLKADVTYSNEGKNKAVTLYINGEQVGTKDLGTISTISSGYEGLEVGRDVGTAVSSSYKTPFAFTGQLNDVVVEYK
ncbi:MAG: arylsulfatase, partial [Chitinophagaceae bacterium]|nr:arylsulfatase [Chitinophagaceae bacterium]